MQVGGPFSSVTSHADPMNVGSETLGTLTPPHFISEPKDMKEGHIGGSAEPGSRNAAASLAAIMLHYDYFRS